MAPSAAKIEKALRQTVRKLKAADEDVAVNAVRQQVENELGLNAGYLKDSPTWKDKSKNIISAAFEEEDAEPAVTVKANKKRASTTNEETARKKAKLDSKKAAPAHKVTTAKPKPAAKGKPVASSAKDKLSAKTKKAAPTKAAKSKVKPAVRSSSESGSQSEDEQDDVDEELDDLVDDDSEASAAVTPKPKKAIKPVNGKTSKTGSDGKHKKPSSAKKKVAASESDDEADVSPPLKQKSTGGSKKSKATPKKEDSSEDTDVSLIDHDPKAKRNTTKTSAKKVVEDDPEDTDVSLIDNGPPTKKEAAAKVEDDSEDTDISLVDEAPTRKRKKKDETNGKKSEKRKSTSKAKPAAASGLSPEEETIKTLQKQLLQCGIRKMWHRELANCGTPQDKIHHLKTMLEDAGMKGRFSTSRAAEIKEARELQAELESATDFQRNWGYDGDTGRGRRARTSVSMRIDDASSDDDVVQQSQGGAKTGLVDFGDSGDSGSEF